MTTRETIPVKTEGVRRLNAYGHAPVYNYIYHMVGQAGGGLLSARMSPRCGNHRLSLHVFWTESIIITMREGHRGGRRGGGRRRGGDGRGRSTGPGGPGGPTGPDGGEGSKRPRVGAAGPLYFTEGWLRKARDDPWRNVKRTYGEYRAQQERFSAPQGWRPPPPPMWKPPPPPADGGGGRADDDGAQDRPWH
jgi:hypothetical protein